jgi:hypothetical protein
MFAAACAARIGMSSPCRRNALRRLATAQSNGVVTHQVDLLPLTAVELPVPGRAPSMQVDEVG